jgi:hypothetical protein
MCAKNLAPTGIRSPDRTACSQSLYRLSYPAHICSCTDINYSDNNVWNITVIIVTVGVVAVLLLVVVVLVAVAAWFMIQCCKPAATTFCIKVFT